MISPTHSPSVLVFRYSIGRHVAAGFAGSVIIGFAMIDELRRLATYEDERMACDPFAIEKQWPHQARRVFSEFSIEDQKDSVI
jgi:hypothetical protein